MELVPERDVWRCVWTVAGAQCVTMNSWQELSVHNWTSLTKVSNKVQNNYSCTQSPDLSHTGSTANPTNIPVYRASCTNNNIELSCSATDNGQISCNGLTVQCQARSELGTSTTTPTALGPDSAPGQTDNCSTVTECSSSSTVSAGLGAVIGVLVLTQTLTIIALIACMARASRQQPTKQRYN